MKRHALTLVLGLPPKELLANSRPHHMARAAKTKAYRYEAKIAALEAMSKQPRAFANALPFRHATAFVTFYRANLRGDKHNLPAVKDPLCFGVVPRGVPAVEE